MADKSKIEWTDATWNPIRGCSVVSEGCRNCYAMNYAARFSGMDKNGIILPYNGLAYRNESGAHWTGQVKLIEEHLEDPLRWKRPRRIFVNSMSDLFHESIPDEWLAKIFHVMARANHHVFQVLSKRDMSKRINDALKQEVEFLCAMEPLGAGIHQEIVWPLPNVQIIASVEDQPSAEQRIPWLLKTQAAVRGISAEPLLGPIDLESHPRHWLTLNSDLLLSCSSKLDDPQTHLDWVIVGGESGSDARPIHPDWARSLRDQCVAAGVPFFFKQWGEWDGGGVFDSGCDDPCGRCVLALRSWDGTRWSGSEMTGTDWKPGGGHTGALQIHRIGKKAAGRLLDGREWNDYPDIALGGV